MLQRDIEIFREARVGRDRIEKLRSDAIGIAIEKANPVQLFDLCEALEQRGQAVANAEVFAVVCGVLADQGNFADARGGQILRFATTDSKRRLRNFPRSCGITQNVQGWSQPSFILM